MVSLERLLKARNKSIMKISAQYGKEVKKKEKQRLTPWFEVCM